MSRQTTRVRATVRQLCKALSVHIRAHDRAKRDMTSVGRREDGPAAVTPATERDLHILFTNIVLTGRTGTETVVRDLALGLRAEGHHPMVFSPELGKMASEIAGAEIPVVSDFRDLPREPDVIHGHHHVETVRALLHFPKVPGIFVCHDRLAWHDSPPRHPRILRYVAVDYNCRERLTDSALIPDERVTVIYNWADTNRFLPRSPLPKAPHRALIFSNYAGMNTHLEPVQEACRRAGLLLDIIGSGTENETSRPEDVLGTYDLVFAKARCALEAMATGAAVILCDNQGLGPLVTMSNIEELRPWNFGMRCLRMPLEPSRIISEIGRYDPEDAHAVSAYVREHATLSSAVKHYLRLYGEVLAETRNSPLSVTEELRDYLGSTVRRLGQLEAIIAQPAQPHHMAALDEEASAHVSLRVINAPGQAPPGAVFAARVEVENRSHIPLASLPPYPIHLSYHWLSESGHETVFQEGIRTALAPPLLPGEKRVYSVKVAPPAPPSEISLSDPPGNGDSLPKITKPEPLVLRLRLTLVQEGVRWFDQSTPPVYAEALVALRDSPSSDSVTREVPPHDAQ